MNVISKKRGNVPKVLQRAMVAVKPNPSIRSGQAFGTLVSLIPMGFNDSTAKTLKFHHEDTESQSFPSLLMLVSPCLCGSIFTFLRRLFNSPYAKRPEGSRKSGLDFAQTFGTVRNINL